MELLDSGNLEASWQKWEVRLGQDAMINCLIVIKSSIFTRSELLCLSLYFFSVLDCDLLVQQTFKTLGNVAVL